MTLNSSYGPVTAKLRQYVRLLTNVTARCRIRHPAPRPAVSAGHGARFSTVFQGLASK